MALVAIELGDGLSLSTELEQIRQDTRSGELALIAMEVGDELTVEGEAALLRDDGADGDWEAR